MAGEEVFIIAFEREGSLFQVLSAREQAEEPHALEQAVAAARARVGQVVNITGSEDVGFHVHVLGTEAQGSSKGMGALSEESGEEVRAIRMDRGTFNLAERAVRLIESSNAERTDDIIKQVIDLLRPIADDDEAFAYIMQAEIRLKARTRFCEENVLLSAAQVHSLSGSSGKNVQATASRWANAGKIFGLRVANGLRYPAFQFDLDGQPHQQMKELIALFDAQSDPWGLALWMDAETELLDGRKPKDMIEIDPGAVLEAAHETLSEPA